MTRGRSPRPPSITRPNKATKAALFGGFVRAGRPYHPSETTMPVRLCRRDIGQCILQDKMNHAPQTLRTVADFASIPRGQLPQCLRAFKQWLQVQIEADERRRASEFVFVPRSHDAAGEQLHRLTDIGQLGLRPGAMMQFRAMSIYALEDFAELTPADMSRLVNVGATTVNRIREMLQSVGLDYRPAEAPELHNAAAVPQQARPFGDDTPCGELNLKPQTLRKLLTRDIATVGALRALEPEQLAAMFSVRRRMEVFAVLRTRGLNLRSEPSELALWRHGLVAQDDLRAPGDDEGVINLQPWLGLSLCTALQRAGVHTIGQLRSLAARPARQRDERGIGAYSWIRIRKYFGMSSRDEPEQVAAAGPAAGGTPE